VTCVAIEQLFFNQNVKTAMQVAEARGVIMVAAHELGVSLFEYSPQAIKIATTGYGNSTKTAVTQMVQQLVEAVPTQALDDEYDAIAVGVTYLAHHGRRT
jgi:crossover junction endodeoxyribonuclease RuvC